MDLHPKIKLIQDVLSIKGQKTIPFSEEKIEKLENLYQIKLPQFYRSFLLVMGNGAGYYMKGSSVFGYEIFQLRDGADELLKENNFKRLPTNAFVFWMHQGYQFAFFIVEGNDDPAVYYYSETKKQDDFVKVNEKLSDFFIDQLSDL